MKTRYLAISAAAALVIGALVPATAASAADLTVDGSVLGAAGPEAGIGVGWIDAGNASRHGQTTSDEEGSYILDIPSSVEQYYLFANLDYSLDDVDNVDYAATYFGATDWSYLPTGIEPFTNGATEVVEQDLTLHEGARISGHAEFYAKERLELVTLGDTRVTSTSVNAEGDFTFEGLAPGRYKVQAEQVGDYVAYESEPVTAVEGVTEIELTPTIGATITGTVKNGSKLLKGVYVDVHSSTGGGYAETNSKGVYRVTGLPAGTYSVSFQGSATATSSKSYVRKSVTVKSLALGAVRTVSAKLASAGSVTGKAKLTKGAKSFTVTAVNSANRTVAFGWGSSSTAFSISELAAGKYKLYFTDSVGKYYAARSVTVKASKVTALARTKLTKKTITLSGSVTGAKSGFVYTTSTSRPEAYDQISSSGKYSLTGLIPGSYSVHLEPGAGGSKVYSVKLSKSTKKTLTPGSPSGKVSGTVLAGGHRVSRLDASYSVGSKGYLGVSVSKGVLRGTGTPGTAKLYMVVTDNPFPGRTPAWYDFPDAAKTVTLKAGKTTALGTFELELHGVDAPPAP